MREEGDSVLPPGYRLDLVGDPCVVVLRREDGTVVARFTDRAVPEEVRRAADEDRRYRPYETQDHGFSTLGHQRLFGKRNNAAQTLHLGASRPLKMGQRPPFRRVVEPSSEPTGDLPNRFWGLLANRSSSC